MSLHVISLNDKPACVEAMEDPAFRYYMERKMVGRSNEPNLHILPPRAHKNWLQGIRQELSYLYRAPDLEIESSKGVRFPSEEVCGDGQQQEVIDLDRTTLQADAMYNGCQDSAAEASVSPLLSIKSIIACSGKKRCFELSRMTSKVHSIACRPSTPRKNLWGACS